MNEQELDEIIDFLQKIYSKAFKDKNKLLATIANVAIAILQERSPQHIIMLMRTEELTDYIREMEKDEQES